MRANPVALAALVLSLGAASLACSPYQLPPAFPDFDGGTDAGTNHGADAGTSDAGVVDVTPTQLHCAPLMLGQPGTQSNTCSLWGSGDTPGTKAIAQQATDTMDTWSSVQIGAASSSDPTILAVSLSGATSTPTACNPDNTAAGDCFQAGISVQARAPGTAEIILSEPSGLEVDRITVVVAETTELVSDAPASAQIFLGSEHLLHVTTYTTNHVATGGVGGVVFTASGSVTNDGPPAPTLFSDWGDAVDFTATAPGAGQMLATGGSATATLSLQVVDASPVQNIALSIANTEDSSNGTRDVYVNADITSASGRIFGAPCQWTTSSASAQIDSSGPSSIPSFNFATADVQLLQRGSYSVTCTLGAATATLPIVW